ncbi:cysteine-rich tail protein 1 [Pelobates fuscus]|uniref:cysteine-rich tail protein 1 n=1 Tax=Pelobates fuscus TaxID=191477 RepID=UPI002FE45397
MTDKNLKNPYGSVNLPRAQLKSSFVRNTIGEDLDSVVIANPAVVPTYPSYTVQTQDRPTNDNSTSSWENNTIRTQESWRRPHNPYGSEKRQNGGHPDAMYNIDLDKRYKETEDNPCCCYPYCKCCPCCRKSCCVVS